MSRTFTVFGMYDKAGDEKSGLSFETAFALMMQRAKCTYRWENVDGETRIAVHYHGPLPEAYECVRNLQSPYFRSSQPNEALARAEIMRSFLRTGLNDIYMMPDESAHERAQLGASAM